MKTVLIIALLFTAAFAEAAYLNTEVIAVTVLRTNGNPSGARIEYQVNDSQYPVPVSSCTITGAEFTYVMAVTGAQRKARVWTVCRPIVKAFYDAWIARQQASPNTEGDEPGNALIGVLSTDAP